MPLPIAAAVGSLTWPSNSSLACGAIALFPLSVRAPKLPSSSSTRMSGAMPSPSVSYVTCRWLLAKVACSASTCLESVLKPVSAVPGRLLMMCTTMPEFLRVCLSRSLLPASVASRYGHQGVLRSHEGREHVMYVYVRRTSGQTSTDVVSFDKISVPATGLVCKESI